MKYGWFTKGYNDNQDQQKAADSAVSNDQRRMTDEAAMSNPAKCLAFAEFIKAILLDLANRQLLPVHYSCTCPSRGDTSSADFCHQHPFFLLRRHS